MKMRESFKNKITMKESTDAVISEMDIKLSGESKGLDVEARLTDIPEDFGKTDPMADDIHNSTPKTDPELNKSMINRSFSMEPKEVEIEK